MMPETLEDFIDLAWRALEAPDDASLRRQIAGALAVHPEWAQEWSRLRDDHRQLQETLPAAHALTPAAPAPAIPPERLRQLMHGLHGTPAKSRRRNPWPWAALAGAAAIACLIVLRQPRAETFDPQPWIGRAPAALAHALTAPLAELVAAASIPVLRDSASVQVRSPLVAARAGAVTVDWLDLGGSRELTLSLRQGGREIWRQTAATSPTRTPPLDADGVYELVFLDAGQPVQRERFVTEAGGETERRSTATQFDVLLEAATASPARLGESVLAWHALDKRDRRSEAGIRLGLWLAVEARQPDILAEIRAHRRE